MTAFKNINILLYKYYSHSKYYFLKVVLDLDACKLCLKKEKGVIHPDSLIHAKTLDLAFEAAIQLNSWEEAMKLGYELIPSYRYFIICSIFIISFEIV